MTQQMLDRKELADLWVTVALAFSLIAYHMTDMLVVTMPSYVAVAVHNALFVWIVGLLWIAYRRWQGARLMQRELGTLITSISTEVVLVVDNKRRIEICNDAIESVFGYRADDVIGKTPDMLYADRRRNASKPGEIRDSMSILGFHIGEAEGKRADGKSINLEISSSLLRNRRGAILVIRDVTDQRRNELAVQKARAEAEAAQAEAKAALLELEAKRTELREATEARDGLTHMVAYEFRSPLQVIVAHAETAANADPQLHPNVFRSRIPDIRAEASRLLGMVNDLMDTGRLESGRFPLKRTEVNLCSVVNDACDAVAPVASAFGITIDRQVPERSAMFDAGLFQRVLSNLLLNAVKRSPRNETILVRCLAEERLLRFEVAYKGAATAADSPAQAREHGPAPTRDLSGSAHTSRLRLAFCKRAVEAHGGNMGVVGKAGSGGGAFWVEIPMVTVPVSLQPA